MNESNFYSPRSVSLPIKSLNATRLISPHTPRTYNPNSEENRAQDPDLLIEPPLQILVGAGQPQVVKDRQKNVRHDDPDHYDAEADAQIARAVDVDLGRRAQQRYPGDEAGDEAHADGEGAHVAPTYEVLVLAPRLAHEAEVDADAAARGEHRHEDRVVG